MEKEIVKRQPTTDDGRAADKKIQGEGSGDCTADFRGYQGRRAAVIHDDQQVHIRIAPGRAVGVRPEEDNPLGRKSLGDLSSEGLNVPSRGHVFSRWCVQNVH